MALQGVSKKKKEQKFSNGDEGEGKNMEEQEEGRCSCEVVPVL
jgi:hypothetical protein